MIMDGSNPVGDPTIVEATNPVENAEVVQGVEFTKESALYLAYLLEAGRRWPTNYQVKDGIEKNQAEYDALGADQKAMVDEYRAKLAEVSDVNVQAVYRRMAEQEKHPVNISPEDLKKAA